MIKIFLLPKDYNIIYIYIYIMGKLKSKRTRNRNRSKNKLYGGRSRKRRINKQFSKRVKKNYLSKKHRKSRKMYGGFWWRNKSNNNAPPAATTRHGVRAAPRRSLWPWRRNPQLRSYSKADYEKLHGPIEPEDSPTEVPEHAGRSF